MVIVDQSRTLEGEALSGGACDHLLRPPKNLGYLGGINYAITSLMERGVDLGEWVAGSNADVRLADDFAERLGALGADEMLAGAAILGPSIMEPERGDVNPFLRARPSGLRILAQALIFGAPPLARAYVALHYARRRGAVRAKPVSAEPERIYAAHGSFFLMRRDFAERQARQDYGSFLFGEEIHLAELAAAWGEEVWHAPALRVDHAMGESLAGVSSAARHRWFSQSRWVLWRAHFAPGKGKRGG